MQPTINVYFGDLLVLSWSGKTLADAQRGAWTFCNLRGYDVDNMEFRPSF